MRPLYISTASFMMKPSSYQQRNTFEGTCASGGKWYACSSGSLFLGCCRSDPCEKGCTQGNLEPAAFNKEDSGKSPDGSCGIGASFYTCSGNIPPFWGCCKSNPCNGQGCPRSDLVGAFMDRPEQRAACGTATLELTAPTTSTSKLSATEPSTAIHSIGQQMNGLPSEKRSDPAMVAGAVIRGILGTCLILGLIFFFTSKGRIRSRDSISSPEDVRTTGKRSQRPRLDC
jgi:hypothetical protein